MEDIIIYKLKQSLQSKMDVILDKKQPIDNEDRHKLHELSEQINELDCAQLRIKR